MDPNDPIQELLKNTGWSCDDLLQRLQQLKSANNSPTTSDNVFTALQISTNDQPPTNEHLTTSDQVTTSDQSRRKDDLSVRDQSITRDESTATGRSTTINESVTTDPSITSDHTISSNQIISDQVTTSNQSITQDDSSVHEQSNESSTTSQLTTQSVTTDRSITTTSDQVTNTDLLITNDRSSVSDESITRDETTTITIRSVTTDQSLLSDDTDTRKQKTTSDQSTTSNLPTTKEDSCSTNENTQSNIIDTQEKIAVIPNLNLSNKASIGESSSSSDKRLERIEDTFSDTDEEESEINATNSSIINEIIEDIGTADSPKPQIEPPAIVPPILPDNSNEVTEVRVIEVSDDEQGIEEEEDNLIESEEIEQLQNVDHTDVYENTADTDLYETITIETEPSEVNTEHSTVNKIEYVEIHPRKQFKLIRAKTSCDNYFKLVKKLPPNFNQSLSDGQATKKSFQAKTEKLTIPKPTHILKRKFLNNSIPSNGSEGRKVVFSLPQTFRDVKRNSEQKDSSEISRVKKNPFKLRNLGFKLNNVVAKSSCTKAIAVEEPATEPIVVEENDSDTTEVNKDADECIVVEEKATGATEVNENIAKRISVQEDPTKPTEVKDNATKSTPVGENASHVLVVEENDFETTKVNKDAAECMEVAEKNSETTEQNKNAECIAVAENVTRATEIKENAAERIIVDEGATELTEVKENATKPTPVEENVSHVTDPEPTPPNESPTSEIKPKASILSEPLLPKLLDKPNITHTFPKSSTSISRLFEISRTRDNFPEESDNDNDNDNDLETSMQNIEDLRNSLKLQLSSLRTRRKNQFLTTPSTQVIDNIECSKTLSLLASKESSTKQSKFDKSFVQEDKIGIKDNNDSVVEEVDVKKKKIYNGDDTNSTEKGLDVSDKNSGQDKVEKTIIPESLDFSTSHATGFNEHLDKNVSDDTGEDPESLIDVDAVANQEKYFDSHFYTQTNEFGLVILDVKGGVELDEMEAETPSHQQEIDSNIEQSLSSLSPVDNSIEENATEDAETIGVFDQIRRIISKQKSKNQNKKSDTSEKPFNVQVPKKNDGIRMDLSSNSGDNSQSSFNESAEISQSSHLESTGIEEKSPFVSDTLDEFLNASRLNISYQVPKLGAEDGVKHFEDRMKYLRESPMILKKVEEIKESVDGKVKSTTVIKAKTVAQKRKILERERRKELKKLEKQKRKELKEKGELPVKEENKPIRVKSIKTEDLKDQALNYKKGYVIHNDKKLWVNSSSINKCIARINCTKVKNETTKSLQRKKWSLLQPAPKREVNLRFRPGPLCQKHNLQITDNDTWSSDLLRLPQIMLEVTPKVGQTFCDEVLHRFPSVIGGELEENKIEFALSMVHDKKKVKKEELTKSFVFPMQYHNNVENILARRRRVVTAKPQLDDIKKVETTDPVADVIEDLIRYVEIKELAPTLIKYDETEEAVEEQIETKLLSPVIDNVSVFKKPRKRTKIESELLRLSCKVVNVELEEAVEDVCKKPYCELGCVCKTLKCEYIATQHCQKVACMFDCACPKEKPLVYDKLMLPAGTDILSDDAVTRIEDEAKKNLAKVEREFTQTVIHTNDKTIVVGIGSRTKTRRNAKTPAKFSDFVPSSQPIFEEEKLSSICRVSLSKWNFSEIIPYCLVHNIYDCYCKGHALFKPKAHEPVKPPNTKLPTYSSNDSIRLSGKTYLRPKAFKKYEFDTEEEKPREVPVFVPVVDKKPVLKKYVQKRVKEFTEPANMKEADTSFKDWKALETYSSASTDPLSVGDGETDRDSNESGSPSKRPVRIIKKRTFSEDFVENDLAMIVPDGIRVKPVPKKYRKSYRYTKDIFNSDFIYNITDADLLKIKLQLASPDIELSEAELLKQVLVQEKMSEHLKQTQMKNKRKQVLTSRQDDGAPVPTKIFIKTKGFKQDAAIQRRKKPPVKPVQPVPPRDSNGIPSVFDGEIIVDEQNMTLLKKMGPKTVADGYARLLPWIPFMKAFNENTINVWSMIGLPSRLLINKADKKCPKNYINIKDTSQVTEVIDWILKNKLPSQYQEDSLSFILKETKDNFEICGICTKNITEDMQNSAIEEAEEAEKAEEADKAEKAKNNEEPDIFYHKDLSGVERYFTLTKEKALAEIQHLASDISASGAEHEKPLIVRAKLPNVCVCRWRMIYLNSDFTYLFFKNVQYSIRYTDLLYIADFAKQNNCTVSMKNNYLEKNSDHVLFGIYFDANLNDRLFIGPYFDRAVNDVETLRYINKSLVSTESFNRMRGRGDYKSGHWLIQSRKRPQPTIDLTSENEDLSRGTAGKTPEVTKKTQMSTIFHNNQEIKILDAPPRKPEDFNRYIVTNIPKFGYLGAYMHVNGEMDISWPFENKLLRFNNKSTAISFLKDRFGALLQPIPESFQISIAVATKIDLAVQKPINSNVLSGHFVCGQFGYYNITTLTDEECRAKVGFSKGHIYRMFSRRAQLFVQNKIEYLAEILNIKKNRMGGYDLPEILKRATSEILAQVKKEEDYCKMKKELFIKKKDNALAVHKILSSLPPEKRNIENLKFRAILHKREPIVINDSDEEPAKIDSSKVFKTPSPISYRGKQKMKSVLKPLISVPIDSATSVLVRCKPSTSHEDLDHQYIKGVKLVKTEKGYMLVPEDKSKRLGKSTPIGDTRVVIQDNKIKSVSGSSHASTSSSTTSTSSSSFEPKYIPHSLGKRIEEAMIIDLDKESENVTDKFTEVHVVGQTLLRKIKADVKKSDESNIKISEYSATNIGTPRPDNQEDVVIETAVIDLDAMSEDDSFVENTNQTHGALESTNPQVLDEEMPTVIDLDAMSEDDNSDKEMPVLQPEVDHFPAETTAKNYQKFGEELPTVIDLDDMSEEDPELKRLLRPTAPQQEDLLKNQLEEAIITNLSGGAVQEVIDLDMLDDPEEDTPATQEEDPLCPEYVGLDDVYGKRMEFSEDMVVSVERGLVANDDGGEAKNRGNQDDILYIS